MRASSHTLTLAHPAICPSDIHQRAARLSLALCLAGKRPTRRSSRRGSDCGRNAMGSLAWGVSFRVVRSAATQDALLHAQLATVGVGDDLYLAAGCGRWDIQNSAMLVSRRIKMLPVTIVEQEFTAVDNDVADRLVGRKAIPHVDDATFDYNTGRLPGRLPDSIGQSGGVFYV